MKPSQIHIIFCVVIFLFSSCKKDDNTSPDQEEISGSVKDENGNPYPNTKVKLFNTTQELEETTDLSGTFVFNINSNGDYKITIIPPLSSLILTEDTIDIEVQAGIEKTVEFIIETQPLEALINVDEIDIFGEIRNEGGMIPVEPSEQIYARNAFDPPIGMLTPIKTPNGHHLILSEWKNALGSIEANCNGNSTKVDISLQGMIPNGTYTFWLNFLNKKKKSGELISFGDDVVKIEPLGSGVLNIQQADSNGAITSSINHSSCILTEEVALVLVVDYHINGNTYGSDHIPDEEDVNHMLVYFQ